MSNTGAAHRPVAEPTSQPGAPAEPPRAPAVPAVDAVSSTAINVKNLSLAIMATLVSIAALRLGSGIFVPLMLGLVFSYALAPLVDRLEKWRLPRPFAAGLVVAAVVGGIGWLGWDYADDAGRMIDSLPDAAEKLVRALKSGSDPVAPSPLEKVEQAAKKLQSAATSDDVPSPPSTSLSMPDVVRVQVERPKFSVKDYLWTGTMGLVSAAGQALVVIVLTFFLLSAGSTFRRKMMKLAGPTFSEKKMTLEALEEVSDQIQRYLLVMVLLSLLTGVVTTATFAALGMHNAIAWGALATVFNLIPYLGSITVAAAAVLAAFLQFGTIEMAIAVGFVCLVIHTVIGQFMTPWLTGRASRMNSVTMFVGVLAWGWVWGLWGLFLAVPILVIVKVVCERIEDLKPIAEFLGE